MHVVLDEKQCEIAGKPGHRLENIAAFFLRHARRRLVEQQDFRLRGERQCDFQKALTPVGQFARDLVAAVAEPQPHQDVVRFLDRLLMDRGVLPEVAGDAAPLGDREGHGLERIEVGETAC